MSNKPPVISPEIYRVLRKTPTRSIVTEYIGVIVSTLCRVHDYSLKIIDPNTGGIWPSDTALQRKIESYNGNLGVERVLFWLDVTHRLQTRLKDPLSVLIDAAS